ncbi:MAG: SurA N-terminal domain-containing protein [Rhodobacteraceae bacterium]|nr:SurA N-terminal domain-containing protein [Paracoccaceae bacterium]
MTNPLRSKKRGNTIIWILMGMLILGLGGFGARNFGTSVQEIGKVGTRQIDVRDYARALNREIAAASAQLGTNLTFAQAQSLGIDRQVQAQVIATTALDGEAEAMGISIGDAELRKRILSLGAFQGPDGKFDRDTYNLTLRREGLSESEFEAKLRDDASRTLLQGAAIGAVAAPQSVNKRLAAWRLETRDFTLTELIPSDLQAPVEDPDATALQTYYEAHPADFTRPEIRHISYIWLSPEMLADQVPLDEAALRQTYQDRIDEFVTPERRLVERLVYPSEAEAEAAKARYDAGSASFAELAAERGLALADIDLGEVTPADLGTAGEAVFALSEPGVVGPFATDLGPALFSMNGILQAEEVTFDEAREDLAAEATADSARRLIADKSNEIEDLLASGAPLEEVAKEMGMEFSSVEYSADAEEGIAAYSAFREAANAATADDFPVLAPLDDGGVFALRLDSIDPPALRPLDEVRDAAMTGWKHEETHKRLVALGAEIVARLSAGEALEASGMVATRFDGFARDGHIDGAPPAVADRVFRMGEDEAAVVEGTDTVHVIALRGIHAADMTTPEATRLGDALGAQLSQSLAQDMFQLYINAVQGAAGIQLNASAINAVHAQLN